MKTQWFAETITQAALRARLDYNFDTGQFRWIGGVKHAPTSRPAGSINGDGYVCIKFNGVNLLAHHLAWFYIHGAWPKIIDHVNHIRHDNRILNLRLATLSENGQNRKGPAKNNKSGFLGVCWHKHRRRWIAQIWNRENGVKKNRVLGYFKDPKQASEAYLLAKRTLHPFATS